MLVLYDTVHSSVVVKYPTRRSRLRARLYAHRIDLELANGASPDATVVRALRAQALARPEVRLRLADSLERLLITPPRSAFTTGESDLRRRVLAASAELRDLIRCLRTNGPASAQGVAKVQVLLTDGTGPLYRNRGDLSRALREAIQSLESSPNWA
jgi:hypothetical protein